MIIDRYIDLLKVLEKKELKEIKVTKDFYTWLKQELKIENDMFYGIKIIIDNIKK